MKFYRNASKILYINCLRSEFNFKSHKSGKRYYLRDKLVLRKKIGEIFWANFSFLFWIILVIHCCIAFLLINKLFSYKRNYKKKPLITNVKFVKCLMNISATGSIQYFPLIPLFSVNTLHLWWSDNVNNILYNFLHQLFAASTFY